jgi:hypothetical protein
MASPLVCATLRQLKVDHEPWTESYILHASFPFAWFCSVLCADLLMLMSVVLHNQTLMDKIMEVLVPEETLPSKIKGVFHGMV